MPCLFERAFLQAVKRRRIHHPTRLKSTIHSFQCAYLSTAPSTRQSLSPAENTSESPIQQQRQPEDTVVSDAMAKLLMRKGFGIRPQCMVCCVALD